MEMQDIDVTLQKRSWLLRLLSGKPKWRIILHLNSGTDAAADSETVRSAWIGATVTASVLCGAEVISDCPFDAHGKRIEATP